METTVSTSKTPEKQAIETLRDTVENLTGVTVKQAQRIENLTTALLESQEQNAVLRERLATLEAPKTPLPGAQSLPQKPISQSRPQSLIGRILRVLYKRDTPLR